MVYRLRVEADADQDAHIRQILLRHINGQERMVLQGLSHEDAEGDITVVIADIFSLERNDRLMEEIVARVCIEPEVKAVSWQRSAA
jgi:putative Mg2+ transporter-C (MgtC) family protein